MEKYRHELEQIAEICDYLDYCGLKQKRYRSNDKKHLYILLGATEEQLKKEADRTEFELLLNPEKIIEIASGKQFPLYDNVCHQINTQKKEITSRRASVFGTKTYSIQTPQLDPYQVFKNMYASYKYPSKEEKQKNPSVKEYDLLYMTYPIDKTKGKGHPFRPNSLFSELSRLKLTKSILEGDIAFGGADLQIDAYSRNKHHPCVGFFALHNPIERQELKKIFGECCPVMKNICCCFRLDADMISCGMYYQIQWKIRNYFGESVALYFQYLSHYTVWLLPVSVLGVFVAIQQVYFFQVDVPLVPYFGCAMIVWSSLFLESWKRVEAGLRITWGTSNFDERETRRPEFKGTLMYSKTTGQVEEYEHWFPKLLKLTFSHTVVWSFILIVCLLVYLLLTFKLFIVATKGAKSKISLFVPPMANAGSIMFMNVVFQKFARKLNAYENHKTDSEYENALIGKTFLFKFVNSYYSLFTIAFGKRSMAGLGYCKQSYLQFIEPLKGNQGWFDILVPQGNLNKPPLILSNDPKYFQYQNIPCQNWKNWTTQGPNYQGIDSSTTTCAAMEILIDPQKGWDYRGECLFELMVQLGMVFMTPLVVGNTLELLLPYCLDKKGKKDNAKTHPDPGEVSIPEEEFGQVRYAGTLRDYDELVVQFGFVVLFVVGCPMVPVLALISCISEFRVDGLKMGTLTRRPYPHGIESIGTWYTMLSVIAFLATVTNAGILILIPSKNFPTRDAKGNIMYTMEKRLIIFLIVEHILLSAKWVIFSCILDQPLWVSDHLEKQHDVQMLLFSNAYPDKYEK